MCPTSSGSNSAQMPRPERKSGIPDSVEMPAPVSATARCERVEEVAEPTHIVGHRRKDAPSAHPMLARVRTTLDRSIPDAYPFLQRVRVRFAETDAMGVAHHGSYLPWLEEARVGYLRDRGHPYTAVRAGGYDIAVVECHVRYRPPAVFEDQLAVHCLLAPPARRDVRDRLPGPPRRRGDRDRGHGPRLPGVGHGPPAPATRLGTRHLDGVALESEGEPASRSLAAPDGCRPPSPSPAAPRSTVKLAVAVVRARAPSRSTRDKIRFRWVSGFHNVRRVSGPTFTKIESRDRGTVARAFTKTGRYRLVCTIHRNLGMFLTVRVKA